MQRQVKSYDINLLPTIELIGAILEEDSKNKIFYLQMLNKIYIRNNKLFI